MLIHAVVASRMTSSRLPGKILMDLAGKPSLDRLVERLRRSKYLHGITIATTTNATDDIVVATAQSLGVNYYRGSEDDVLKRTLEAAEEFQTEYIVQVTSDCPLIDDQTIDAAIERMLDNPYLDYVGNHLVRTYPLGFSAEVFRTDTLREVDRSTKDPHDREHVSLYMYERPEEYRLSNIEAPVFLRHPEYRLTLDTLEDYELISRIYMELYPKKPSFDLYDIVRFLQANPSLKDLNKHVSQKKAR